MEKDLIETGIAAVEEPPANPAGDFASGTTAFDIAAEDIESAFHYMLTAKQKRYLALRRGVECFAACLLLLLLAIPFLFLAIIQKALAPKEPVFFRQERIGRNGKKITITKFRSMRSSAPHYCSTSELSDGGQYISGFGRFLRDYSVDELPQLLQVVSGRLSLVGPRPLIPQEAEVHRMRLRAGVYQLRPGITGWAQINGRDLVTDRQKVELDFEYLQTVSLKTDLKILKETVKKVFRREGVREGGPEAKGK